ncbi:MAG TPA: phosphate ABC transporter, permease protein PstA, partial [Sphingobium sp.]|nr:phosphate ABC transporter, permease protein PstA [Sphingobium sp.]
MSSPLSPAERLPTDWKSDAMRKRIARRYAAERRFRLLGLGAVLLSAAFLAFLLVTMMGNGLRGFTRTEIALKVDFPASPLLLDPQAITDEALANANLPMVTSTVAEKTLGKEADAWLAPTAWISVRDAIKADPTILNRTEVIRV